MQRLVTVLLVSCACVGVPAAARAGDQPCATIDVVEGAHSVAGLGGGADAAIQAALQAGLPHAQVQTKADNSQWLQSAEQEQAQSLAQEQQDIKNGMDPRTAQQQQDARDAAWMAAHPPPSDGDVLVEWSAMALGSSVVVSLRAVGADGKNYYGNYATLDANSVNTAPSVLAGFATSAASAIAPNFICLAFTEPVVGIPFPCQNTHTYTIKITDLTGADSTLALAVILSVTPGSASLDPMDPLITGQGQSTLTVKAATMYTVTGKVSPPHQKDITATTKADAAVSNKLHVTIDGVRELDAEQLWNMKNSPFGVLITPFRTLLESNGAWTFYGKGTQTDHLSGDGTVGAGGTSVAFSTDWTARFNTPTGAMDSPAISVSFNATPYTIHNTVELDATANGPNVTALHFAPNLTMLSTPAGLSGSGIGVVHVPGGQPFSQQVPLNASNQMGAFFMTTPFDMTKAADGTWPKKFVSGSDEGGSWVYTVAICGGS